ncbi:nonribosomal peptide synthetase aclP [Physcia stellaris]|nr:nonribosomal peptide synthetase aclP [Physcia stellaris]
MATRDTVNIDLKIPCSGTEYRTPTQPNHSALDVNEYPMTEVQLSLIYGTRKIPGTNIVHFYEVHQTKHLPSIKRAWQVVVGTEPIFRTSALLRDGKGCLIEQNEAQFHWYETTVSSEEEYNHHVQCIGLLTDLGTSFHVVTRLDSNTSTVIWIIHHSLIDGHSSRLILQKVKLAATGEPISSGPSFARMAERLKSFQQHTAASRRRYWRKTKQRYPSAANRLHLPTEQLQIADSATSSISIQLPQESMATCARSHGVTMASFLYAAWALTLAKYADSDLVVFGVLLSSRNIPLDGIEEVVGPLINLLPLHFELDRDSTTVEYLQATFSRVADLMDVSWSHPDEGFDRKFSSALAIGYERSVTEVEHSVSSSRSYSQVRSDIPLYLLVEADGLCWLNHHRNIHETHQMEVLGECFSQAIYALMEPQLVISECLERLTTQRMRAELYSLGQCSLLTTTKLMIKDDLVTLFDQTATRYPALIAVQKAGESISYAALSALSHRLGRQLSTIVEPEMNQPTMEDAVQRYPVPEKNAYLCFTSGSTGLPKGVMCRHDSLVAFQSDLEARLLAGPRRKIAQTMSPAFDGSIHELFSTLSYGATLILEGGLNSFDHLYLADSAVMTPSLAAVLDPAVFRNLKTVYFVGEPVPQNVNDRWTRQTTVYNMYGPTEATCGATIKRLATGERVTIGKPNPSTRIYILGSRQDLLPPGVVGEICLAGIQISEGYIGQPVKTAKCFMRDPFSRDPAERMYRTGDYGYWNQAKEIVYVGRKDRQIKLRGFRVDLDDIEVKMLKADPTITALSIVQKDEDLAVMVQSSSLSLADFKSRIVEMLPRHAIPRFVKVVKKLPLTVAGKVDYAVIENSFRVETTPKTIYSPSSTLITMIETWRAILSIAPDTPIEADSNFLDLGGSSVQQMLLASYISSNIGCPVPLQVIIDHPIIGELVDQVSKLRPMIDSNNVEQKIYGLEVSRLEEDWWKKYQMINGSSAFSVALAYSVGGLVHIDRLTDAWNVVLAHHRILSCRFVYHRRRGLRRVFSTHPPRVETTARLDIWQEINRPFDMENGNLIRIIISKDYMVVMLSHIICDLTTLRTLLCELKAVYYGGCLVQDKVPCFKRSAAELGPLTPNLQFWTTYLADLPSKHYGYDHSPDRTGYHGVSEVCQLPKDLFSNMIKFAAKEKVTYHQMALAAVALAVHHDEHAHDIVLGAPYLNRDLRTDQETIGLFLEPLPIRIKSPNIKKCSNEEGIDLTDNNTETGTIAFLHSVQASSQAALCHAVPWHRLLEHLNICQYFPDQPLFDIMVTFHDDRQQSRSLLPGCKPLYTWSQGSKFKIMTEFVAISEQVILLRIEYDTDCFTKSRIFVLQQLIASALQGLMSIAGYDEMKQHLRSVESGTTPAPQLNGRDSPSFFGLALDELLE